MLAYPLAVPSALKIQRARLAPQSSAGVNVSPFTGEEQIYVHQGEWHQWELSAPPMDRDDGEEVAAFLMSLNGFEGSFLCPPPGYGRGARGSLAGAPVVMGSAQSGKTLATDGWTPSAANVVKRGDWFQLGSGLTARVYKIMQAASANVYGAANLEIWPRLRESPSDNDALVVASPVGLFRLAELFEYDIETALIYGVRFSVREAI